MQVPAVAASNVTPYLILGQATAAAHAGPEATRDKLTDRLPVPVGQAGAGCRRQLLDHCPQLRPLGWVRGGGEPPVCPNISAAVPPHRRPVPIGRQCVGPVPAPPPWPLPSSPGPAARRPASVPAPWEWAPGSSAGADPWHSSPIVPETALSPSHHHQPLATLRPANLVSAQIYPIALRISPWFRFRVSSYSWVNSSPGTCEAKKMLPSGFLSCPTTTVRKELTGKCRRSERPGDPMWSR